MPESSISLITVIIAGVAALSAAISTLLNYNEARLIRATSIASVYLNLRERFSKTEMNDALASLYRWHIDNGEDAAKLWIALYSINDKQALKLNQDRRMIHIYVSDVFHLYETKAITKKYLNNAITYSCFEMYRDVCAPMHDALYGERRTRTRINRTSKVLSKILTS